MKKVAVADWLFFSVMAILIVFNVLPMKILLVILAISVVVKFIIRYYIFPELWNDQETKKNKPLTHLLILFLILGSSLGVVNFSSGSVSFNKPLIAEAASGGYWRYTIKNQWTNKECKDIVKNGTTMSKLASLLGSKGNYVSGTIGAFFGTGWANMIKPFQTAVKKGTGLTISYTWNIPKSGPVSGSYASNTKISYK
ncbi:hypothetical protein [Enterococcus gallinarum]|uniref:hypothetical protein n=1 Tax=Enterococcus gallinarum TaxID=1353 RepID=UPI002498A9EF|nr:hypothetical protein [Enterococcus gallinarum]GMG60148.1 hypothetical protein AH4_34880 [Enterococcus gallinarum]